MESNAFWRSIVTIHKLMLHSLPLFERAWSFMLVEKAPMVYDGVSDSLATRSRQHPPRNAEPTESCADAADLRDLPRCHLVQTSTFLRQQASVSATLPQDGRTHARQTHWSLMFAVTSTDISWGFDASVLPEHYAVPLLLLTYQTHASLQMFTSNAVPIDVLSVRKIRVT